MSFHRPSPVLLTLYTGALLGFVMTAIGLIGPVYALWVAGVAVFVICAVASNVVRWRQARRP